MKRPLLIVFLVALDSSASFAGNWSGFLVDSECYVSAHGNTRHGTHAGSIDNNRIIRSCMPKTTTKSFAVVLDDSSSLTFDSEGNEKARELVQKAGKAGRYRVQVNAEMADNTLRAATIRLAK